MLPNTHQRDSAASPSQPTALDRNTFCYLHSKDKFVYSKRMNYRMGRVSAAEFANRNRLRSQKPLPKRGQIKSKIAANAFHSIISVISRASSSGFNSPRKN
ncbi:unnamed protein product [Sphenostylis stenocarpa]|uniref:Uncharacterized protein n=1 Tax=Sphenostylis stenocarpa TaxID=92480 RepID=A0AA86S699_9FABA|nr:unnamed protein product [Sphenostylis stenocarpa]